MATTLRCQSRWAARQSRFFIFVPSRNSFCQSGEPRPLLQSVACPVQDSWAGCAEICFILRLSARLPFQFSKLPEREACQVFQHMMNRDIDEIDLKTAKSKTWEGLPSHVGGLWARLQPVPWPTTAGSISRTVERRGLGHICGNNATRNLDRSWLW
ncbi:hypothetical protein LZ32DRAFT_267495 [Colletotrichum eremochloae]|nr:hypothetical protein LZ32DRAFT_267495 [Colletotrichum eremochloae]